MSTKFPIKEPKFHLNDDHLGQEIRITCEGAGLVALDELCDFQGNLKNLSSDSYERLKQSILQLGFSFPVAAWKDRNKIMIIDAHQRVTALKRMRSEGYKIPPLPVVWVQAANAAEAAKKILASTSQYGDVQVDGLHSFMERFEIDLSYLQDTFKSPEIDFDSFRLTFFPETEPSIVIGVGSPQLPEPQKTIIRPNPDLPGQAAATQWTSMPEFVQEDKGPFRSVVVHFFDQAGVDQFAELVKQKITDKTRMMWFPEIVIERAADKRYGNFEP